MTWKTNKRSMQLGLFPQTDLVPGKGPRLGFRELQAVAQAAEEIGFDPLWLADHLLLRYPQQFERHYYQARHAMQLPRGRSLHIQ